MQAISTKMRAVCIGLGRIGMLYDLEQHTGEWRLKSSTCQSHSRALSDSAHFELIGGIEIDPVRRRIFEETFDRPAFQSLGDAKFSSVDLAIISVPDQHHYGVALEAARQWRPRLIVCEKPVGSNFQEACLIQNVSGSHGAQLVVNFFRQFFPESREITQYISSGAWGDFYYGSLTYSHGLRRNGSHFLMLLDAWLGGIRAVRRRDESSNGNVTYDLEFALGEVHVVEIGHTTLRIAEMTLVFSKGILRYQLGGGHVSWHPVASGEQPQHVLHRGSLFNSNLDQYQTYLYDWIAHSETGDASINMELQNAMRVLEVIDEVGRG